MIKTKRTWEVIAGTQGQPRGFIGWAETYSEAKKECYKNSPAYIKRGPDYGK